MNDFTQDEISIYDIWSVAVKRKKIFWLIFGLFFIIGCVAAILHKPEYRYTQTVQIANYVDGGKIVVLRDPKNVIAQLSSIYLPSEINRYNVKHIDKPVSISENNFTATDLGDGVLALTAKGSAQSINVYAEIFTGLIAQSSTHSEQLIQSEKSYFKSQLANLQKQLAYQEILAKALFGRSSKDDILLQQIIVAKNQSNYTQLIAAIAKTKQNLATLEHDHALSKVIRSSHPVGMSSFSLLLLFVIVGFVLGLFAVFAVEFFAKAKEHKSRD
ncbi:MAG: hypothetical protein KAT71_07525 [Gammaproteobacteria bacterium]|nr:hypothetical protein [Gammaproteobacteria bacterium]